MSTKGLMAAVLVAALAGGGYAALRYTGLCGSHSCCQTGGPTPGSPAEPGTAPPSQPPQDDAALAAAQGYCPIMETKLGEMGDPVKVMVKDKSGAEQPVFICCMGCKRKVLANPATILAKVAELKGGAAPK